jgi:hypothetical protein
MPLSRKRGRDNFKQLVKDCTCPINVLTKARIEKFASRARAYICTYHHLEQKQQQGAAVPAIEDPNCASPTTDSSIAPIPLTPNRNSYTPKLKGWWKPSRVTGALSTSTAASSIPSWKVQRMNNVLVMTNDFEDSRFGGIYSKILYTSYKVYHRCTRGW